MGKLGTLFQKPLLQNVSAWIGFIGFFIGLTAFLTVRMWFGKAVQDFNYTIAMQEQQGAQLVAAIGNGFTIIKILNMDVVRQMQSRVDTSILLPHA
ncbi:hypothetical protein H0H92_012678 [Tricholoma furcatifolium]|nr:hypothetical protein H0H92_012678 [Tricholoma furcatifolium]